MTDVTFVEFDGTKHSIQADSGQTLMQLALDNGVPGIDADCGGGCACGTCHVIISEAWQSKVSPVNDSEEAMLSMSPDPQVGSRLACQIEVTDDLDGLVVQLPEFQM